VEDGVGKLERVGQLIIAREGGRRTRRGERAGIRFGYNDGDGCRRKGRAGGGGGVTAGGGGGGRGGWGEWGSVKVGGRKIRDDGKKDHLKGGREVEFFDVHEGKRVGGQKFQKGRIGT